MILFLMFQKSLSNLLKKPILVNVRLDKNVAPNGGKGVTVSLKPGETQLVAVRSFDVQRLFYYYGGPRPRKVATPFKVAFRLLGYDIPVGKPPRWNDFLLNFYRVNRVLFNDNLLTLCFELEDVPHDNIVELV